MTVPKKCVKRILVLILLLPVSLLAQTLTGHINEHATKQPIEGVRVEVVGTYLGAISDSLGRFVFPDLKEGEYRLRFSHIGYHIHERMAFVGKDAPTALGVILWPKFFALRDEIVHSARRMVENWSEIPEMISFMDEKERVARTARTAPELMMGVPGVWVQKTHHGGGSAILRGLGGNQNLLLIDGIRINNSTYGNAPNHSLNTIDPFTIGQIEVLRGGGSVAYGSDAIGGVIQIRSPELAFARDQMVSDISFHGKYMSADMERSLRGNWELQTNRLAVRMGISYKDFGDLLAGGDLGYQIPSGYEELDGDFKAMALLGQRQRLTLVWQRVDQRKVGFFDHLIQPGFQVWQIDPLQRQLAYLRWERTGTEKWMKQIRITLFSQSTYEQRLKKKQQSDTVQHEQDDIFTLGVSLEQKMQPTDRWEILSGLEIYRDQIGSSASSLTLPDSIRTTRRGFLADGATATNASVFSLHSLEMSTLRIHAGLRYNLIQLDVYDSIFGPLNLAPQALVGHLATSLYINKWQSLSASVQTGFRAPNINDMSRLGSFDGGVEVPSPKLASERSLLAEIGYKVHTSDVSASLSLYQIRLFDLIDLLPATYEGSPIYEGEEVYRKDNSKAALIRGAEMEGEYEWSSQWMLYSSLAYTFGRTLEDIPAPLRRIPPLFGLTGVRWALENGFGGRIEYRYAGKQDRLSEGDIKDHRIADGGTAAWQVLDAYLSYEWKMINGRIGLQNLFNEAYRMHGSGVDGYGRSVWLAIQIRL